MTPEQYTLFTGLSVQYDSDDWETIVSIAEMRLASFLCLEEFPEKLEGKDDLALLLANFIASVLRFQGDGSAVTSKKVRNFTINFKTSSAADAFSQIATQYADIIAKYSQCDSGVIVERPGRRSFCGCNMGCL